MLLASLLMTVTVLWIPGAVIARLLAWQDSDPYSRIAMEIALGLSWWPLIFLLSTSAGFTWTPFAARALFAALAIVLIVRHVGRVLQPAPPAGQRTRPTLDVIAACGAIAFALVVWTRLRHIAGVAYPVWVDSVHHTMIIRLLLTAGRLPATYAPFIPDSTFYYHWGYHSIIAFVAWIGGWTGADALPRLVLDSGQMLNMLTFFAVYCGAKALLRDRRAATLAAVLATLVSFFPAFYVSWGRYTLLTGLLVLPPLAKATWQTARHPSWRRALLVAILAGGLLLIHVRAFVFYAILSLILALILLLQRRFAGLAWCAAAAAVAFLLASPWMLRLATTPQVRTILSPGESERWRWEASNEAPADVLWAPHHVTLFTLASGGMIGLTPIGFSTVSRAFAIALWLALALLLQRHAHRRRRGVRRHDGWRYGIVAAWFLITALLINLDRFGLPRLRVLTNSTAIISLFLPVSIAAAHLIRWSVDALTRRRLAMPALILLVAVAGAATMIHMINPTTLLVTSADRDALGWIRTHTPPTARFAPGVQPWIGGSQMGVDGGYWIALVSERSSILPPGLYPWVMSPAATEATVNFLDRWYEAEQNANTAFIDVLRQRGVTHLYFGPRNDMPIRAAVAQLPSATRIYHRDGVDIYEIR